MMDGFDLESPLVCEGVIGDGCGGGRIFFLEDETLYAYDPMSKERTELLTELLDVQSISKSACLITIISKKSQIIFDLSKIR